MRIAVDVMGGDHGCGVVIEGVRIALESEPAIAALYLVGNQECMEKSMPSGGLRDSRAHIVHASEVLTMDDKPAAAVRKKKDCSIVRAVELVREGKADAVVSLGNTGGIFAAATFGLGRVPGVERGAIAAVIPNPGGGFVLVDAGANIECKPLHLAQFAVMGSIYSREILGVKRPRVGILSIGTEETKGNELTLEAFKLCKNLNLNFVGNVEGHDLFEEHVDVVVCDGFVGNIVLKTCESLANGLFTMLKQELSANAKRRLGGFLARNAFRAIQRRTESETFGGAPILGFNGAVLKAHGSAKEKAVANAIRVSTRTLKQHVNQFIGQEVASANERLASDAAPAANAAPSQPISAR